MLLAIRHTTRYHFAEPVVHGLQRLRLTPKETQGQTILDWTMEYVGAREELAYDDQNHNHVTLVSVEEGAQEVVITCRGTVRTEDKAGVIGRHAGHLPLWAFLGQTELTRPGPRIRQLVASVSRGGDEAVPMLHDLSATIRERVAYETGQTHVNTTAEEAMAAGHGVCQDHAQIFIAAARALEIPARYVSVYAPGVEPPDFHAVAEVFLADPAVTGGGAWHLIDATKMANPGEIVKIGVGRDAADVSFLTSFGASEFGEKIVSVIVEPASAKVLETAPPG